MIKPLEDKTEVALTCPNCGPATKLVVRTNGYTGHQFLGCPNYPECEFTQELPESLKMEQAGAQRLPGF